LLSSNGTSNIIIVFTSRGVACYAPTQPIACFMLAFACFERKLREKKLALFVQVFFVFGVVLLVKKNVA